MHTDNMNIGNKILFILGMSLCGVLFFVLVTGVIVALFISWDEDDKEHAETNGSAPIENKKIVWKR